MENWISQQADFYPTVLSSASVSFQTGLLCPPPRYVLCCWMPHLLIHSEVRLGIGDDFPVPLMKISHSHFVAHIQNWKNLVLHASSHFQEKKGCLV